jgi:anti-anti-sigma factor
MNIEVEQKENVKMIKIKGRVMEPEVEKLAAELQDLSDIKEIRLDVSGVKYCCSSFLGVMVRVKKRDPQIEIKLINPNEFLIELISLSRVGECFTLIATE